MKTNVEKFIYSLMTSLSPVGSTTSLPLFDAYPYSDLTLSKKIKSETVDSGVRMELCLRGTNSKNIAHRLFKVYAEVLNQTPDE